MRSKMTLSLVLGILTSVHLIGQRSASVITNGLMGESEQMVHIGLDEQVRFNVADRLNKLLADEYMLYVKTQKYHWNVVGPLFGPLHKLFNKQYDQLAQIVDEVAERVRALGFKAYGTLAEFVEHSSLSEEPGVNPDATGMITHLLHDHETVIRELRDYIKYTAEHEDIGTENFLSDLIVTHQKTAWMLRAHLLDE